MKTRSNLRTRALGVLASILSAGALSPQLPPPASPPPASAPQIATTTTAPARPTANTPPTSQPASQALANLLGSGGMAFRAPGCPPHIWGQSTACKQLRLKNVRRGIVPHYRPRARG